MVKEASLLLWDEAAMQHRHAIEAIDRTLRDFLDQSDLTLEASQWHLEAIFSRLSKLSLKLQGANSGSLPSEIILWPKIKACHLTENIHGIEMILRVPGMQNGFRMLAREKGSPSGS
jgi:PIF1-like helicase